MLPRYWNWSDSKTTSSCTGRENPSRNMLTVHTAIPTPTVINPPSPMSPQGSTSMSAIPPKMSMNPAPRNPCPQLWSRAFLIISSVENAGSGSLRRKCLPAGPSFSTTLPAVESPGFSDAYAGRDVTTTPSRTIMRTVDFMKDIVARVDFLRKEKIVRNFFF